VEQHLIFGIIRVNEAAALTSVIVTVVVINTCTLTTSSVELSLIGSGLGMKVLHRERLLQCERFLIKFGKNIGNLSSNINSLFTCHEIVTNLFQNKCHQFRSKLGVIFP